MLGASSFPMADPVATHATRPPRWGFSKGFLTGLVIEIPIIAAMVWCLAQVGIGDASVGFARDLRFTAVFAGIAAVFTAGGIGRLAAWASIEHGGGRKRAVFVAARAHALAGVGLVIIAAIPHGHLPEAHWRWGYLAIGGLVAGAACGAMIGVVCGGAAPMSGVVAVVRRPTELLRALLDPEQLVRLGSAMRVGSTQMLKGMFKPGPTAPPPDDKAKPPES